MNAAAVLRIVAIVLFFLGGYLFYELLRGDAEAAGYVAAIGPIVIGLALLFTARTLERRNS